MAAPMIPKHTVAITLSPNITCVLEAKREQGISAVLKVTGRRSVTLQPHTWKALMGKKDLLGAITSCLNVYDEDAVWISRTLLLLLLLLFLLSTRQVHPSQKKAM